MKKKLLSLLLAALLLLPCALITSAEPAVEARNAVFANGEAQYSITYSSFAMTPSECDEKVKGMATILEEMSGGKFQVYDGETNLSDREIFIGGLNEKKLVARMRDRILDPAIYRYNAELLGERGFVIRTDGERYIINGGSDGLWFGLEYFATECLGYDCFSDYAEKTDTITVPAEVNYLRSEYFSGTDGQTKITLCGADISEYTIVYPEGDDTYLTLWRAVGALTGAALPCTTDAGVAGRRIFLQPGAGEDKAPRFFAQGDDFVISGGAGVADALGTAVTAFLSDCLNITGGVYTGNGSIDLPAGLDRAAERPFDFLSLSGTDYGVYMNDTAAALMPSDATFCYSDADATAALSAALENAVQGDTVYLISNTKKYCDCAACRAADEAAGSPRGAYWRFAADFAAAHPALTVVTLAYRDTFLPPSFPLPANLRVIATDPEVCCAHALGDASCEKNKAFADGLAAWSAVCTQLYVADFTMQYYSYPSTFPNLDSILQNAAFYKNAGVCGVYMNWDENEALLEFSALRRTLLAAAYADPDMTEQEWDTVYAGALTALYHDKADCFAQYIEKFTAAAAEHFTIFSKPAEILPITQKAEGGYELTLAKELAALLEAAYERHEAPPSYSGLKMHIFAAAVSTSDFYQQLRSRVQFSEWVDACVPVVDHTAVYGEIIASFQ